MKKFIIEQIILLLLAAPTAAEQINLGVRLSQGNPGHTAATGGDPAGRAAFSAATAAATITGGSMAGQSILDFYPKTGQCEIWTCRRYGYVSWLGHLWVCVECLEKPRAFRQIQR